MFIEADEKIIIMEMPNMPVYSVDDLCRLKDAGVRTVYKTWAIDWASMQPSETSPIDWYVLDRLTKRVEQAGLKLLLPFVYKLPAWKPDDWYLSRNEYGVPNYANPQACADLCNFAVDVMERYTSDKVQVIYGLPCCGEFPYTFWPAPGVDPLPHDVLTNFIVAIQELLEPQHGEVWTAFHPYGLPAYYEPIYQALAQTFPKSRHYAISFTHFPHHPHTEQFAIVKYIHDVYGVQFFVGSEYCDGLKENTESAIQQGIRFITAPIHSAGNAQAVGHWNEENQLKPWMLETIKNTIERMRNA